MNSETVVSDCILRLIVIWTFEALVTTSNMSYITASKEAVSLLIDTRCKLRLGQATGNTRSSVNQTCATASFHSHCLGVSSFVAGRSISIEAAVKLRCSSEQLLHTCIGARQQLNLHDWIEASTITQECYSTVLHSYTSRNNTRHTRARTPTTTPAPSPSNNSDFPSLRSGIEKRQQQCIQDDADGNRQPTNMQIKDHQHDSLE